MPHLQNRKTIDHITVQLKNIYHLHAIFHKPIPWTSGVEQQCNRWHIAMRNNPQTCSEVLGVFLCSRAWDPQFPPTSSWRLLRDCCGWCCRWATVVWGPPCCCSLACWPCRFIILKENPVSTLQIVMVWAHLYSQWRWPRWPRSVMEFSQEVGDPSIGMYSLMIYEHHDQVQKEYASTLMGKKTPDPQLGKQVTAGYQETAPQLQWQDNKPYKPNHETIESVVCPQKKHWNDFHLHQSFCFDSGFLNMWEPECHKTRGKDEEEMPVTS